MVLVGAEHNFTSAKTMGIVAFIALGFACVKLESDLLSLGGLGCCLYRNRRCSSAKTLACAGL